MFTQALTKWRLVILVLISIAMLGPQTARGQSSIESVDGLLQAVLALRAKVPPDARTAGALGTERAGSAIVIDANGLLLTIGYLVLEADEAEVETRDGRIVPVEILAYDHGTGFGLLRATEALNINPVKLGDSDALEASAQVLIASHGGARAARPAFVVSRREFAGYWEYLLDRPLYTAPPHPLFAGAALLGADGRLLGVGSLLVPNALREERQIPGNLFVPIDLLKPILADLLVHGRATEPNRPWLGIYSDDRGGPVVLGQVATDGPASRAGLKPGDAIVGVADEPVTSMAMLYRKLWRLGGPGTKVRLNVLRQGQMEVFEVRSGDRYDWLRISAPSPNSQ